MASIPLQLILDVVRLIISIDIFIFFCYNIITVKKERKPNGNNLHT